jgi:hypothetical protein
MDMRQFTVPRIESPPPRGTATDFINAINAQMVWMEHHKKPHEVIRIFCGGAFGVFRAVRISPASSFAPKTVRAILSLLRYRSPRSCCRLLFRALKSQRRRSS